MVKIYSFLTKKERWVNMMRILNLFVVSEMVVSILCIVSFTLLILLVLVWRKRRNKRNILLQYVRKYTEKRVVGYLLNIPNELKKLKKSSFEKNFEELFWPLAIVFYNSLLFLLLNKTLFIFWSASSLLILVILAILVWALAINDYFVTLVPAMRVKAIMLNEDLCKMLMSYTSKIFAFEDPLNYVSVSQEIEGEPDDEKLWRKQKTRLGEIAFARKQFGLKGVKEINDPYDIVRDMRSEEMKEKNIFLPKFLRNIRWVGIPPFYNIYSYRFRWASFEQRYNEKTRTLVTKPITIEKMLRYVTLKDDVYNMTVESAETQEVIPLNVEIAITANIINPRKALFQIEKWLEVVVNQVGAKIRKFVGTQGYFELVQAKFEEKNLLGNDLKEERLLSDKNLEFIISSIRSIYGVNIKRVQIKELNPATKEAEEFIKASIQEFISARQSAGWKKEAEGLERKFGAISKIRGGQEMYIAEQYGKSGISALSFGGGVGHYPTFPIPEKKGGEKK